MAIDLEALSSLPRTTVIRRVQSMRDMPLQIKLAIVGGLGLVSDADYANYARLMSAAIRALALTAEGRAVLDELGLVYHVPEPAG